MDTLTQGKMHVEVSIPRPRVRGVLIHASQFGRHTPRSIRGRLALAQHRREAVAAAIAEQETSLSTPVAHNAITGKAALGPWLGPFDSADEPAPPLYMDAAGVAFGSLDGTAALAGSASSSVAIDTHNAHLLPLQCCTAVRRQQMDMHRVPRLQHSVPHPRGNQGVRSRANLKQPRRGF